MINKYNVYKNWSIKDGFYRASKTIILFVLFLYIILCPHSLHLIGSRDLISLSLRHSPQTYIMAFFTWPPTLAAAAFWTLWSWRLGESPLGEPRAGGDPTGGEVGPLTDGESDPPAGDVGGEKSGEEAGELPDLGSETIDMFPIGENEGEDSRRESIFTRYYLSN